MGVMTFETVIVCAVPPSRIFKSLVFDLTELVTKSMPQVIESVDVIEGDTGVGTIRQLNFGEGFPFKYLKQRVEAIDEEKQTFSYSVIEGNVLIKGVEKVLKDLKFEVSPDGFGTIMTTQNHYYTNGDYEINEDEVNKEKERSLALFKAYLVANPDA